MKLMTAFALFTIYHKFGKNMIHFLLDKLVNRNYRVTCKKYDSCKHKKVFWYSFELISTTQCQSDNLPIRLNIYS